MALAGPSGTRAATAGQGTAQRLRRIWRYAWSQKRYLVPGCLCVVIVAATYSINIMALLPTIHLIAGQQGVPSWIHQGIAERRLNAVFDFDAAAGEVRVAKRPSNALLPQTIKRNFVLTKVDAAALTPGKLFNALAYLEDGREVALTFLDRDKQPVTVHVLPEPLKFSDWWLRRGAALLPQGSSADDRLDTLKIIVTIVVLISVVGGASRFFAEYLIALTAACVVLMLRKRMYYRVLRLPVSKFATHGVSDLVSRFVQDSQDIYRGLNFLFAKSLREPLKAIFVFCVALVIDWRLTLITAIAAPVGGYLIRRLGKMIRKANKRLLENYGRMLSALQGTLTGIRVVKGYTMETFERQRLHLLDKQMLRQQMKIERIDALSSPLFEFVGQIVAALAILYFANQMLNGLMEFSKFATLAACMAGMFDPVRKMSSFYNRFQTANAAMDRVFEIIDMADEVSPGPSKPIPAPPFSDRIEFRDVTYTYPGATSPALNGINLTIRRGERVAFVGPNGSGKTTLLSLLMRFFEQQEGTILIDGRDLRDLSIASLRRQMSLLTQDTVIFADTIAHNIAYGDGRLLRKLILRQRHPERRYDFAGQEDRIVAAARAAYADEFIREKPQGYDSYVGEHGVTLSGGQKQRIAIARAILRNAPIFIFDEATSQVDSESEQRIHDAVEKFLEGRTALIIAHRFSTILQADRIVVMDRGRIVDSGRHDELIRRCRLYQSLYGTQIIEDAPVPDVPATASTA